MESTEGHGVHGDFSLSVSCVLNSVTEAAKPQQRSRSARKSGGGGPGALAGPGIKRTPPTLRDLWHRFSGLRDRFQIANKAEKEKSPWPP